VGERSRKKRNEISIHTTTHIPDVAAIYMIQVRAVNCGDCVFLKKSPCVAEGEEKARYPQGLERLSKII
jgi:hypothetical protein